MNSEKGKKTAADQSRPIPICPRCEAPVHELECTKTSFSKRPGVGYPAHTIVVSCPACHVALGIYPL